MNGLLLAIAEDGDLFGFFEVDGGPASVFALFQSPGDAHHFLGVLGRTEEFMLVVAPNNHAKKIAWVGVEQVDKQGLTIGFGAQGGADYAAFQGDKLSFMFDDFLRVG